VDLAVLVDQQGPDDQRILRLHARGCANGRIDWLERCDEPAVTSRQIAEIPSAGHELTIHTEIAARAAQAKCACSALDVLEPFLCLHQGAAGMRERPRRELTETQPTELFAGPRACAGRQNCEGPLTFPVPLGQAVDTPGGLGKALLTPGRQAVFTLAALFAGRQPAFVREADHGGAYQALGQAEHAGHLNEAAQSDHTSSGGDRIAEERDDE